MRTYLFGLIALALLVNRPLFGESPTAACNAPAACGVTATCGAPTTCGVTATCGAPTTCGGTAGCEGGSACNGCGNCCPHCGCRLTPVCHVYCTTKPVVKHVYTCKCEDVCFPPCSCCCKGCGCCGGHCCVREVNRLVIHPVVEEHPVRKCTVEWVCPNCGASGGQYGSSAAPTTAPVASTPDVLIPLPETTNAAHG